MGSESISNSTPDYTAGYSEDYLRFLSHSGRRGVIDYLVPYLRPGLRVLDLGCGPGFISVWLAEAVAPGELYGIDMETSQIDMAREFALEKGCDNATFRVADIADLPFEDDFFDVASFHDVLAFVPDTSAALAEVKRVLKPGGVVGCRELIVDSSFAHPELGVMKRGFEVYADLLAADDGHPQIGKDLKNRLLEAGFGDIRTSASFNFYDTAEEIEIFYDMVTQWFLSVDIAEAAKKYGAATDRLLADMGMAVERWKGRREASAALAFGEAVATRP